MPELQTLLTRTGSVWQCLAGYRIGRILSADLFMDLATDGSPTQAGVAEHCRNRWTDLAGALAVLPEPTEFHLVFACIPGDARSLPVFDNGLLAVGRGRTQAAALKACRRAASDLNKLFTAFLDYAEFEPVTDPAILARLTAPLDSVCVTEIRRRQERLHVGHGHVTKAAAQTIGITLKPRDDLASVSREAPHLFPMKVTHLFPWVPSDDSWWRLVDVMEKETGPTALVVHARGWATTPGACRDAANRDLEGVERVVALLGGGSGQKQIMQVKTAVLHMEASARLAAFEGPMIGARIFLASRRKVSAALLSVVESSVDDPSANGTQTGGKFMFRGGAQFIKRAASDLRESLDTPTLDQLFSPREATAVLRTPMPTNSEYPGFPLNRARTAPMLGGGQGGDCPLGLNVHRGMRREASMGPGSRFRHCYIIGQTGTGKSTLLLHQIMHDIHLGRGVAVLDPHGSLMEDILLRFPRRRAKDLLIVDMSDIDHPVGFNPLYLTESDPLAYRMRRDLVIDELYAYLDRVYDMKTTGGPVFEMHFRAMLGLLMGLEAPQPLLVPNLLVFRMLYTNERLRERLTARIRGKDPMLEEFITEALGARSDMSLKEVSAYITSKFSRFVSDLNLRNITCQNRTIDFDDIVGQGKVLLFNLGKGRIGETAAGLLASQVVSRIQMATMRRGREGAATPYYLYADEFQLVASARFAEMLAEGRKFGLSVTVAHQFTSQVPAGILQAVVGNVGTLVLFRVGAADAEFFAPLYAPVFGQRDLTSLPNFRAYVRGSGQLGAGVFNVDVAAAADGRDPSAAEFLRQYVRRRFGRERVVVEAEIAACIEAFRKVD
jgi:hypothetical protein